jgi:hypothetical protein
VQHAENRHVAVGRGLLRDQVGVLVRLGLKPSPTAFKSMFEVNGLVTGIAAYSM